ncbi:MAG: hypothetical protein LBH13_06600 [Cellulomonadaceae bacterium]|nr:hypothetical protein [Cellulomonadaceae bacterium]
MPCNTSDVRQFAARLSGLGGQARRGAVDVLRSNTEAIKRRMRADLSGTSFKAASGDVWDESANHGDTIANEIGLRTGAGHSGNIANIAYWGGRTGGGSAPEPATALEAQQDTFVADLNTMIEGLLT